MFPLPGPISLADEIDLFSLFLTSPLLCLLFVYIIKRHLPLFIQAYFPLSKKHFLCQEKLILFFRKKPKRNSNVFEKLLIPQNRKFEYPNDYPFILTSYKISKQKI